MFSFFAVGAAHADDTEIIDEILARYNASRDGAARVCGGLASQIDSVKTMAGIGVGAGALGATAGTIGAVVGIMHAENEKVLRMLNDPKATETALARMEYLIVKTGGNLGNLSEAERKELTDLSFDLTEVRAGLQRRSERLGTVRTAVAFTAGAAGIGGAAASFSGRRNIGDLISDMQECNRLVQEIDRQRIELAFVQPEAPALAQMANIVASCSGLNHRNMETVRDRLRTAGIISVVGATTGIVGGVTSMVAKGQESGHHANTAATVLSGASGAANLGGAILSGSALSGLNANSAIARRCAEAF